LDFIKNEASQTSWNVASERLSSRTMSFLVDKFIQHRLSNTCQHNDNIENVDDVSAPAPTDSFISRAVSTHPAGRRNRVPGTMSEEDGVPRIKYWEGAPNAFQGIHTFLHLRRLLRSPFLDGVGRMHMRMIDYIIILNHLMTAERMFFAFHE